MSLIVKQGLICLPEKVICADILIEGGKIAAIGEFDPGVANETINAKGHYVLPGFIDFHVHLDDQIGDYYIADTYRSGSRVAITNGITTIVSFVTQYPYHHNLTEAMEIAYQKANGQSYCDLAWHLTPTTWDDASWEELGNWFERGFKTLKLYTTYKQAGIFSDYALIEKILTHAKKYNVRTIVHCEDEAILDAKAKQQVDLSDAYSITKLRPKSAEIEAIRKLVELSTRLQAPVHIVHVSTVEGAEIIQKARVVAPISCETCPQYLFLDDHLLKGEKGYRDLCTPPFRDEENQKALNKLARENFFDIFVTDHCPFVKSDKDEHKNDLQKTPKGLPGLGALPHMIHRLFKSCSSEQVAQHLTHHLSLMPAKLAGLYPQKGHIAQGADADLVIVDFEGVSRKIHATLADVYDPYTHFSTSLTFKGVFLSGKLVVKNNELIDPDDLSGKCLSFSGL